MKVDLEFDENVNKIWKHIKQLSNKDFELFEKDTGYNLPESYKQFLLKQNGGLIKTEFEMNGEKKYLAHKVVFYDGETTYFILTKFNIFNPYENKEGKEKYFIIEGNEEEDGFSSDDYGDFGVHLIIGEGYNGDNSLTLCLSPEYNYGKIYIFNNHCDYQEIEKDCLEISDSFEEFMNTFELVEYDS